MYANPYSHRRYRKLRLDVLASAGGVCWICGRPGATTVDHVRPVSTHPHLALDPANMRAAHLSCNSERGARAPERTAPPPGRW
jgi:5-methylcytosine-specific restriction endonuclease McrA